MTKNDRWIRAMAEKGMIEPFNDNQVRAGVVSFGVGSYGYDLRVHDEYKIPRYEEGKVLDPKRFDEANFTDFRGPVCEIPARSFVIARSLEYFRIPREVLVICFGKSTYARCGVVVNVTPLEPEWEGYITMSVANVSPFPVRVHSNEGIAQLVFIQAADICETSYADKKGKYQAQKGIVLPKI